MKVDTLKYFIKDSMQSLKLNRTLTIGTTLTISATFFISGLFLLYIMSLNKNSAIIFTNNKVMVIIIRYIEEGAFVLLPLISLLIIVNGFKMVVAIREYEISIMKSIGATEWFIRWPFIIQGLVMGIIGSFVANVALFYAYRLIYNNSMEFLKDLSFVEPTLIIKNMLLKFVIVGAFIGIIGSMIAIRKALNYR